MQESHNRHERRAEAKREKMFQHGYARPLGGNDKARLFAYACALSLKTEDGKHYGKLTAKYLRVLRALLWVFHNAKSGLCFPSYESLMKAADCARSTVYEAIRALEAAGVLKWVNRSKHLYERGLDLFGQAHTRSRVVRTSNGYSFTPVSSKSDSQTGTPNQPFILSVQPSPKPIFDPLNPLHQALARWEAALEGK